jgi:Asp-tRNA(Asn)/Glu-tRNA(Gln) amidotransferase C subunit
LRAQSRSINSSVRNSRPEPVRNKLVDIDALLSKPTWSVRSLLPDPDAPPSEEITPAKLHHLLRLSALPLPKSLDEEAEMLKTLHSQLHFVKDIQKVDTEGVEPLRSIRDETEEGVKEITIGMEDLKEAFEKEEIKGRNRRPRRRRGYMVDAQGVEDWDVLGTAGEKVELAGGKYFVVRSGKE